MVIPKAMSMKIKSTMKYLSEWVKIRIIVKFKCWQGCRKPGSRTWTYFGQEL